MNWKIIKELFRINLIYANPNLSSQQVQKQKKKGRTDQSIFTKLVLSNLFQTLFMTALYTVILLPFPLVQAPTIYDRYLVFLLVLGIIQSFMMFYNVIYDAKDLVHYQPLPLGSLEIYLAKVLTVAFTSSIMVFPMLGMTFLYLWKIGYPLWTNLLLSLYFLVFLLLFFLLANILLMEALARTGLLYRMKNKVLLTLNILVQLAAVLFIVKAQALGMEVQEQVGGQPTYGPISGLFASPGRLPYFFAGSLVLALAGLALVGWLGKNFMDHYMAIQSRQAQAKKKKQGPRPQDWKFSSLARWVLRYKWNQVLDPTIFSTTIVSTFFFLFLPVFPILTSPDFRQMVQAHAPKLYLTLGIFLALALGLIPMNLQEMIISLDNENYSYMKALPLKPRTYLRLTTLFVSLVYLLPAGLVLLAFALYFRVPWTYLPLGPLLMVPLFWTSAYYQVLKDYLNPHLGWQNVQELFGRSNKLLYSLRIFATFFFSYVFTLGYPFLLSLLSPAWGILLSLGLVLVFCLVNYWRIRRKSRLFLANLA